MIVAHVVSIFVGEMAMENCQLIQQAHFYAGE